MGVARRLKDASTGLGYLAGAAGFGNFVYRTSAFLFPEFYEMTFHGTAFGYDSPLGSDFGGRAVGFCWYYFTFGWRSLSGSSDSIIGCSRRVQVV